jgi:hypothetical protein
MPGNASGQHRGTSKESRLDRAIDVFKPQPAPPSKPAAPSAKGNRAWEESVGQHHVVPGLTVHDVGLSVYGETRSLHNRHGSNESIGAARQKVAHVVINGAEAAHRRGEKPPKVHGPIEPPDLSNPEEHAAYESSLRAAREAYLNGHDPTRGATHFSIEGTPSRANKIYKRGTREGVPIRTQSGPYYNSYLGRDVKSHKAWVNTYGSDHEKDK